MKESAKLRVAKRMSEVEIGVVDISMLFFF